MKTASTRYESVVVLSAVLVASYLHAEESAPGYRIKLDIAPEIVPARGRTQHVWPS